MPKHDFGIIDEVSINKKVYEKYEPKKYNCIDIDDDYILPILEKLKDIKTYFHDISVPEMGLNYFGITLIPPESLKILKEILTEEDNQIYKEVISMIEKALLENKFIIHYGI